MNRTPHPHQSEALAGLRDALRSGLRRVMLSAPTGAGKTLLMAMIAEHALAKGNRVIITVPALSLIDQTVEALRQEGITAVGVMQGAHPDTDPNQPVQVCSIQTLARRKSPQT